MTEQQKCDILLTVANILLGFFINESSSCTLHCKKILSKLARCTVKSLPKLAHCTLKSNPELGHCSVKNVLLKYAAL